MLEQRQVRRGSSTALDAAEGAMQLSRLHRIGFSKQVDYKTSLTAICLIRLLLERRDPRTGLIVE